MNRYIYGDRYSYISPRMSTDLWWYILPGTTV